MTLAFPVFVAYTWTGTAGAVPGLLLYWQDFESTKMALIKSGTITQASGSVGGFTFSHNRGGLYIRARTIPVDPSTIPQQRVRSTLAVAVEDWVNTLSQAQRDAWDLYAFNVPLPGPLGDLRNVGGLGMLIRAAVVAKQFGLPAILDAPTIFNVGSFTPITIAAASEGAQTVSVAFDGTDAWANEDDAAMCVWISRPQNPTINFFKGPYRIGAAIFGDPITPPTSPVGIAVPFAFVEGQKLFVKVRVIRVDGRVSNIQRDSAVAVA